MSGLLRRIKRSRAAGAGENPAEEQAAGPEAAPTTAGTPAAGDPSAETAELQAGATPAAPLIRADPDVPAGLDPAESGAPPATGRRGRLRRRLRYLRRARELMLRDLGGLFYEVHRTAGGDVAPHSAVIVAKVERLAGADAEAAAIEAALGAPRSEVVVFEPGIGGTCDTCGELYGSAARFCSACGSPTGSVEPAEPAPVAEARPVPPMPQAPATQPEPAGVAEAPEEEETKVLPDAPDAPAAESAAAPAPEEAAPPSAAPADADEPQDDGNPFSGLSNGRTDDEKPPELSSGDPLAARESGT
jgi:hypothetical protein